MTSKEALFNLVRIHYGYENKNDFDECVKVLEKDLEVLNIIKNKVMPLVSLERNDETDGIHYRIYDGELYQHSELDEKQFDLLKEWLEK